MFNRANELALKLANQFVIDFPPSLQELSGRKAKEMFSQAIGKLKAGGAEAQRLEPFGLLSRIVVARTFQGLLARHSYNATILRQATAELASSMTFSV